MPGGYSVSLIIIPERKAPWEKLKVLSCTFTPLTKQTALLSVRPPSLTHSLTCVGVVEAQHGVVEHQQVGEPHGRAQVIQKVTHRVAQLPDDRQRAPLAVRHDGSVRGVHTRSPRTFIDLGKEEENNDKRLLSPFNVLLKHCRSAARGSSGRRDDH